MSRCEAFMVAKCSYAFSFTAEGLESPRIDSSAYETNSYSLPETVLPTKTGSGCLLATADRAGNGQCDIRSNGDEKTELDQKNHMSSLSDGSYKENPSDPSEEVTRILDTAMIDHGTRSTPMDARSASSFSSDRRGDEISDAKLSEERITFFTTENERQRRRDEVVVNGIAKNKEKDLVFLNHRRLTVDLNRLADDFVDIKEGRNVCVWGDPPVLDSSVVWDRSVFQGEGGSSTVWVETPAKASAGAVPLLPSSEEKVPALWDKPPSLTKIRSEEDDDDDKEGGPKRRSGKKVSSRRWLAISSVGAGLQNLGNTCFVNATLQCLTYTPPLVNYLLAENNRTSCRVNGLCLMCELGRHMTQCYQNSGNVIRPHSILHKLKVIAKHMRWGRQEDAHEFLRYMVDAMNKSCINGHQVSLDNNSKETIVNKIFGGYLRSQVTCLRCKAKSNTYDPFLDISLDVKNVSSIVTALQKFVQPETLDIDNAYNCTKCQRKVRAQKRFTIHRLSNILTIQLKRYGVMGGKVTRHIAFPEKLDLRPYMSISDAGALLYQLYGVLVHDGHSTSSGHYYCYVMTAKGDWYCLNDHMVRRSSLSQVLIAEAYLLLYIRQAPASSSADSLGLLNCSSDGDSPIHREGGVIIDGHPLEGIIKAKDEARGAACRGGQLQGSCKGGQITARMKPALKASSKLQYSSTMRRQTKRLPKRTMKERRRGGRGPCGGRGKRVRVRVNVRRTTNSAPPASGGHDRDDDDDDVEADTNRFAMSDAAANIGDGGGVKLTKDAVVVVRPVMTREEVVVSARTRTTRNEVNSKVPKMMTNDGGSIREEAVSGRTRTAKVAAVDFRCRTADEKELVSGRMTKMTKAVSGDKTSKKETMAVEEEKVKMTKDNDDQTIMREECDTVDMKEKGDVLICGGLSSQAIEEAATSFQPRIVIRIKQGKVINDEEATTERCSPPPHLRNDESCGWKADDSETSLGNEKKTETTTTSVTKLTIGKKPNVEVGSNHRSKTNDKQKQETTGCRRKADDDDDDDDSRGFERSMTKSTNAIGHCVVTTVDGETSGKITMTTKQSNRVDNPPAAPKSSFDVYDFSSESESDDDDVGGVPASRKSSKTDVLRKNVCTTLKNDATDLTNDNVETTSEELETSATMTVPGLNIPLTKRRQVFCPRSHKNETSEKPKPGKRRRIAAFPVSNSTANPNHFFLQKNDVCPHENVEPASPTTTCNTPIAPRQRSSSTKHVVKCRSTENVCDDDQGTSVHASQKRRESLYRKYCNMDRDDAAQGPYELYSYKRSVSDPLGSGIVSKGGLSDDGQSLSGQSGGRTPQQRADADGNPLFEFDQSCPSLTFPSDPPKDTRTLNHETSIGSTTIQTAPKNCNIPPKKDTPRSKKKKTAMTFSIDDETNVEKRRKRLELKRKATTTNVASRSNVSRLSEEPIKLKLKMKKLSTTGEEEGFGFYRIVSNDQSNDEQSLDISHSVVMDDNRIQATTVSPVATESNGIVSNNKNDACCSTSTANACRPSTNLQARESRNIFQNLAEAALHTREEFTRQTGLGWTYPDETGLLQVETGHKGLTSSTNQHDLPTLNAFNWIALLNKTEPDETGLT